MAFLDFVILRVNGIDVSGYSHEDAIRVFLTAQEPITVEVKRRQTNLPQQQNDKLPNDFEGSSASKISVAVQTDDQEQEEGVPGTTNSTASTEAAGSSEEPEEEEVDIEEVTLRKIESTEKIGLTVTYVAPTVNIIAHPESLTEVYISNITPNSLAARDGRLKKGDQILQVNGCDVSEKTETESLFAENPNAVTLLVSRCPALIGVATSSGNEATNEIDDIDERVAKLMSNNCSTSDIEHIYETIPEDDTECEPIYCSPLDTDTDRGDCGRMECRDPLAFEVFEEQNKLILGQINKWRCCSNASSHQYFELTNSPRKEMPGSMSSYAFEVQQAPRVRTSMSVSTMPTATIYTNPENLQNVIAQQERVYRRALAVDKEELQLKQPVPSTVAGDSETRMEWKVKRRHDGTRYIVRRPIETRRQREARVRWRRKHAEQRTQSGQGLSLPAMKYPTLTQNVGLLSVTIV
ncbi:hypothetical protein DMENIID0001_059640 [Sergentomyia squamirostris]